MAHGVELAILLGTCSGDPTLTGASECFSPGHPVKHSLESNMPSLPTLSVSLDGNKCMPLSQFCYHLAWWLSV